MRPYFFHISPYEILSLGILFTGLTLALVLGIAKRTNQTANLVLSSALVVIVLKAGGLTPLFFPVFGPLLYFYVQQLTRPGRRFTLKGLVYLSPLLAVYWVPEWLILISTIIYLFLAQRLILDFYSRLKPVLMDRPRFAFRRLQRVLMLLGLLCFLSLFWEIFYFAIAFILIIMVVEAILKPGSDIRPTMLITGNSDEREKGRRLKEAIAANRLYEDAELTLTTLALKLGIHPHDLSRIINHGLGKNFSDFINEFRVREIARKMQDRAYDRFTLLAIAYESGFNSKRTFNRVFKEMTGRTPAEYKNYLKKKVPIDKVAPSLLIRPVLLRSESPANRAHQTSKRNIMIRSYLKIAYRNLSKNKGFTSLNILGLAAGLTTCLLIVFYVTDELGYDRFNTNFGRIYRVNEEIKYNGDLMHDAVCPAPLAATLAAQFPGIESTVRFRQVGQFRVKKGSQYIHEDYVTYCDNSIFKVFTLPVAYGNVNNALSEPNTVVLTQSMARKYFNHDNAVGETIILNGGNPYKVTAVIKDIPSQSHFRFDFFISMPTLAESKENSWMSSNFQTYLLLKPGADPAKIARALPRIVHDYVGNQLQAALHTSFENFERSGNRFRFSLMPLADIHLRSDMIAELGQNGNIQYVYIFSAVALFILLIACVNFINLSTASSAGRAREVGVRKVLGSPRRYLIWQFLIEAILVVFAASVTAAVTAYFLLPLFNQVSGKQLVVTPRLVLVLIPALLAMTLIIGCLAGAYPALYLSAFQPIHVLKGKLATGFRSSRLRSFLVVFQFTISIFLIIGTLVIYSQLKYIQNKDLGYNREQVLTIYNVLPLGDKAILLKDRVKQLTGVRNATLTGYTLVNGWRNSGSVFKDRSMNMHQGTISQIWDVDPDYIPTMGMTLLSGRNFSVTMATDSSAMIINESAARLLGLKNPLNQALYRPMDDFGKQFKAFHVIGVVRDFNFSSLRDNVGPLILRYAPNNADLSVKINAQSAKPVIEQIRAEWNKLSPDQQFSFAFMNDDFNNLYSAEQRTGTLSLIFTSLAIIIASLGLFGLAAYAAEQRTKEIGIRKVFGAKASGIVAMLSLDFIKLVIIAIIIAAPLAWWVMEKQFLQGFAYRTAVHWYTVALASLIAVVIAFTTISFQSIKAALTNPVKSLRSE